MIRFGRATLVYVIVGIVGQVLARLFDEEFMRALGGTGSMIYGGSLFLLLIGTWLFYLVVVYADIQRQEESMAWLAVVFFLGPLGAILYAAAIHESGEQVAPSTAMRQLAAYWFRIKPPGVAVVLAAVVAVFLVSPGILKAPCHSIETVEGPAMLTAYDTGGKVRSSFGGGYTYDRLQLHTDTPVTMVNITEPDGEEAYGRTLDEPDTTITASSLAAGVKCKTFTVRLETADGRTSIAEIDGRLQEDHSYMRPPSFDSMSRGY